MALSFKIVLFKTGRAFEFYANRKMSMYNTKDFQYLGIYTKEELKKLYPNTSIQLSNDNRVTREEKILLEAEYRREKIDSLLKSQPSEEK